MVYHVQSGDTHVLNPAAAALLQAMQRQGMTVEALRTMMAEALDSAVSDEVIAVVDRLIGDFDELGLIEPLHESP